VNRRAADVVVLGAVVAMACGPSKYGDRNEPSSRGPAANEATDAPQTPAPVQPERRRRGFDDTPTPKPTDTPKNSEEDKAEKRDLGAELQTALGSPVGCLETRPANEAPERIVISVNAQVMGSGRVSRANVASSALNPGELECIRKRAESTRLAGPIDDAPLAVTTSIELTQQKPAPP
jgi:hypothetical protein